MSGLLQVPFFPDEVFSSYLARFARANGAETAGKFCRDMDINFRDVADAKPVAMQKLSVLTGTARNLPIIEMSY
jgi:TniQ